MSRVERGEVGNDGLGFVIDRRIFRLGIPSMVASLSVPLIGIVDTALVGHLPEVAFLGAVSAGSVIFDVLYWGLGFLRMGTTALTAQYFGAGQRRDCTGMLLLAGGIALVSGGGNGYFEGVPDVLEKYIEKIDRNIYVYIGSIFI